jgi:hypothetical protein
MHRGVLDYGLRPHTVACGAGSVAAAACRMPPAFEPGWAADLATKKSTEDRS